MALILSIVTTTTFATIADFAFIVNIICLTLLVTIFYQLPFFYSLLVAYLLNLLGAIFEYGIISFTGKVLRIPIDIDTFGTNLSLVLTGLIYLIIAWLIEQKKLGFMFISRYFSIRYSVKGYNLALSSVLIVGIVLVQVSSLTIMNQSFAYSNFVLVIVMVVVFLLAISIAYKENKKQLDEKHERLKKR
jgi:hypothetical protein